MVLKKLGHCHYEPEIRAFALHQAADVGDQNVVGGGFDQVIVCAGIQGSRYSTRVIHR